MKQYEVTLHETITKTYTITAGSAEEARAKAMKSVFYSGIVRRVVKSVRVAR